MNINRIPQDLLRLYGGRSQGVGGGGDAAGASGSGNVDDAATTARGDGLVLSEGAAALGRAITVARSAPDIREALVSELRQQVLSGTYQHADEAVARRLLAQDSAD